MSTQFDHEITLKKHQYKTQLWILPTLMWGWFCGSKGFQAEPVITAQKEKKPHHTAGVHLNGENMTVAQLFWSVSDFTSLVSIVASQHSYCIIYKLTTVLLTFFGQQGRREHSGKQNQTRLRWKRGRKF